MSTSREEFGLEVTHINMKLASFVFLLLQEAPGQAQLLPGELAFLLGHGREISLGSDKKSIQKVAATGSV